MSGAIDREAQFLADMAADLRRDEGFVPHAYQDHLGFWTIGIGRLVDRRKGGGISEAEAVHLLANDIGRFMDELDRRMGWWRGLDAARRRAVLNMAFQMGVGALAGTPTFDLIRSGDHGAAADRLGTWKWARQTPARARRVIETIRTGRAP